jgi:OOP family OmpA-OmpF porin
LAGITVRLGPRPLKAAADADPDKDGIAGSTDKCPEQAGPAPDGCPKTDSDGDGVADVCDRCPDKPSPAPDGCPVTDRGQDLDGDGVSGAADRCPREAGPAPDGCPLADPDGDGIAGAEDRCPDQAETFNAFEDRDGCPDEIPPELETLNIEGQKIAFGVNTAELDQGSRGILDAVADSLRQFSETRIEISGHTDNRGSADYNLELSRKRADAVVNYLVGRGIDRGRLVTRGAGADEPVADNRSERGRAANRRIEFRLLPEP